MLHHTHKSILPSDVCFIFNKPTINGLRVIAPADHSMSVVQIREEVVIYNGGVCRMWPKKDSQDRVQQQRFKMHTICGSKTMDLNIRASD
jgi:hypothetical protein